MSMMSQFPFLSPCAEIRPRRRSLSLDSDPPPQSRPEDSDRPLLLGSAASPVCEYMEMLVNLSVGLRGPLIVSTQ